MGTGRDWESILHRSQARIAVKLARQELAEHRGEIASYASVEHLAQIVLQVANHVADPNSIPTWELLEFALDVMVLAGAGSAFEMTGDFLKSTTRIIDLLDAHDLPTTDLLLAQARYFAGFSDGGNERRAAILRAVQASQTVQERIKALTVLGRYSIDTSDYPAAPRHAAAAMRLAADTADRGRYLPDILTTFGISYFYADLAAAEPYFRRVVEVARGPSVDPLVAQPLAEAYHYLGRIAAEKYRHRDALDLYILAQHHAIGRLTGLGYHHLRMAEVLLNHGPLHEALFHLTKSSRAFAQGQQVSTGEAQMNAAWARYFTKTGNMRKAEELLRSATEQARRDHYPRGELLFLAQLASLRIAERRLISATGPLLRVAWKFVRTELRPNQHGRRQQLLRATAIARRMILPKHKPPGGPALHCPCGADHNST